MDFNPDLLEAAFRWLFSNNSSGLKARATSYYIAIGPDRIDPDPDVVRRFLLSTPPVKPVSDSVRDGKNRVVLDRATGQPGIEFRVESLRVVNDGEFEFEGGYYEASRSASGGSFTMTLILDEWQCTGSHDEWLS